MDLRISRCPDCAGAVSTSADACPHCGRIQRSASTLVIKFVFLALIIAGMVMLAAFVVGSGSGFGP